MITIFILSEITPRALIKINNGTGFYEKEKEGLTLHTHIGFKENRAIFFDSTIYHSPLLFAGNSGPRYAMANWIGV